jgi:tRNA threonylcarbamoyladenosine biosynthesis protein TsaB
MALILCIETATKTCSVAIVKDGIVLAEKSLTNEGYGHAENLHPFIESILKENQIKSRDLNAIAISAGPGSYTGLRIGVSAAKGLCFSLQIPLIAVNTLQLMCFSEKLKTIDADLLAPMIDARRDEVYTALFLPNGQEAGSVEPKILDEHSYSEELTNKRIAFFGDGAAKFKNMIQHANAIFVEGVQPLASQMATLASDKFKESKFEDVAYFEPFYLKEFIAGKPKKTV